MNRNWKILFVNSQKIMLYDDNFKFSVKAVRDGFLNLRFVRKLNIQTEN